jgi:hypothetical protein
VLLLAGLFLVGLGVIGIAGLGFADLDRGARFLIGLALAIPGLVFAAAGWALVRGGPRT